MEKFENKQFSNCVVELDNRSFVGCKFKSCCLLFSGEGGFFTGQCEMHDTCVAVHDDVHTIVEMLSQLSQHGATELFSIISAYLQGQSSFTEYSSSLSQRPSAEMLLNGKLFFTIEFLRAFRDLACPMGTGAAIDHIHQQRNMHEGDNQREASVLRDGAKYVYLEHESYVNTWVNGGMLPLVPLSTHKDEKRHNQKTPDENVQYIGNQSLQMARRYGYEPSRPAEMSGFENCVDGDSNPIPDLFISMLREEDCLGLCFANSFSAAIAGRFDRRLCVRIENIDALKAEIDKQLGVEGIAGNCKYTIGHNRHHFLKYIEDSWQDEFRIIWPTLKSATTVELPPGYATAVAVSEFKCASLDELKRIGSIYADQLTQIDNSRAHKRPVPSPFID